MLTAEASPADENTAAPPTLAATVALAAGGVEAASATLTLILTITLTRTRTLILMLTQAASATAAAEHRAWPRVLRQGGVAVVVCGARLGAVLASLCAQEGPRPKT